MFSREEKKNLVKKHSESSPVLKNSARSFIFGGLICALGEILLSLFIYLGIDERDSFSLVTLSVIFIASVMTATGIFGLIARFTGAGTLVPVSGFSNSVTSEAIDAASEGYVLGVGSKIFTVAGPVILFGILSGVIYGIFYYFFSTVI